MHARQQEMDSNIKDTQIVSETEIEQVDLSDKLSDIENLDSQDTGKRFG